MKGRVIVCAEYGKPFAIEEYEVPEAAPESSFPRRRESRGSSAYRTGEMLPESF